MEYWTIINDRHAGPYSADELIEMGLQPDSPVWMSGLPDWVEASEIEELRIAITNRDARQAMPTEPAPAPMVCDPLPEPEPVRKPYVEPAPGDVMPQMAMPRPEPAAQDAPRWEWQQQPVVPDEPCPPAYLVWSIIVTILCCQVLGIAAIICSAQTKQAYNRGNLAKAKKMSEWAQWLIIISIVAGLVGLPIQLAFLGV